ncbi:MAG TPA: redoxin domain-containing protein, partial [Victivallales bacterium]|nr:redoxin domain-containing protein [Victivallales bacterium]
MKKIIFALLVCLTASILFAEEKEVSQASVGKTAPEFSLPSVNGETISLSSTKGKIVVLEWTNYQCPFVKKFYGAGKMQELQKEYTDKGVIWLSICSSAPGKQGNLSIEQWKEEIKTKKSAATHVLVDEKGDVGKLYKAKTTPHMFIIDKEGILSYMGAIDDQPSANPEDIKNAKN